MRIWDGFLFTVGVSMTLPVWYFVSDRIDFVRSARSAMGTVDDVRAWHSSCGTKESPDDCTNFEATLRYSVDEEDYRIEVSAGREYRRYSPISDAEHQIDDQVPVVYDPRQPSRAYRDTFWDVWRYPIWALIVQVCALYGGFTAEEQESRRLRGADRRRSAPPRNI